MGEDNFLRYIGRFKQSGLKINTKKLSEAQSGMIATAYRKGINIRVIGAYRDDFEFLLRENNAKLIGEINVHNKPTNSKGIFNRRRQVMGWVSTSNSEEPDCLWILVFPSEQYVDQMAELVKAIVNDYSRKDTGQLTNCEVTVSHFPKLEKSLAIWTGFSDFIKCYIRHGDAVVIGNIELLIPGIQDHSFVVGNKFNMGGLNEMFGINLAVNQYSATRMVLIGVAEAFWGDASAQYVKSIMEAGAMHILYGSKAASLVDTKDVHGIYCPAHFSLIDRNGVATDVEYHRGGFGKFIENLDVYSTGFGVTVPTVIGESLEQRQSFERNGMTCMDCENGHIAEVVFRHNQSLSNTNRLGDVSFQKRFIPIHFITDYIYRPKEKTNHQTPNLGISPNDEVRDDAFRKIGQAFAVYALTFGTFDPPIKVEKISIHRPIFNDHSFKEEVSTIRPMIDAGLGEAALTFLSVDRTSDEYRIVPAIAHLMVCQKEGYINSSLLCLDQLKSPLVNGALTHEERLRIKILELKIYSQTGSISKLGDLLSDLNRMELENLANLDQLGAVKRREAIYYGLLEDQTKLDNAVHQAKDRESESDERYLKTNTLFKLLAELHIKAATVDLDSIATQLSDIRKCYLNSDLEPRYWQTNYERSALGALFLEAAYYLSSDYQAHWKRGAKTLTIAHLINSRLGGNEVAEIYGEVVACTKDLRVRNILSWAMRQDHKAATIFQNWISTKFETFPDIAQNFKEVFRLNVNCREDKIQELLQNKK